MGTGKDRGARRRAWEVLWRTQRQGAYPDLLLTSLLAADPSMEKSDRALAHELVMGTLRWQLTLDRVLSKVSQRPLSRIPAKLLVALRLGAYQLLFLERIPASAAVNETVELVRSIGLEHATGFANAVLRAIAQRGRSLMEVESTASLAERISVETSHPLWMVEMWLEQWGERETRELCQANNEVAPLTLRTNTLKITREGLLEALREEGVEATPTPFSPEGVEITGLKVPSAPSSPSGWGCSRSRTRHPSSFPIGWRSPLAKGYWMHALLQGERRHTWLNFSRTGANLWPLTCIRKG
jgi:tRNA and rRNA cytosine-C5-methylases